VVFFGASGGAPAPGSSMLMPEFLSNWVVSRLSVEWR